MPAHIIVRDLWKRYGGFDAVQGVSFEVAEGEVFGLLGPNGAGKTTTLECLVGLREADRGQLELAGVDARLHPQAAKERIGVALQSTALPDAITPREALQLFGSFYRRQSAPAALLERFALADKGDAPFAKLSGGQRQRLALALAFVNEPAVVVLDEPTTGLDPQTRRELHAEIARMKRDGCTVLLSTHQLAEAESLCDRIAIIDHGRVIATGAPRELVARSSGLQSISCTTLPALAQSELAKLPELQDLSADGDTIRFRSPRPAQTLAALTALIAKSGVELVELHVSKASLEDVFLRLTQDSTPASAESREEGKRT